jgi:hypothetical protein
MPDAASVPALTNHLHYDLSNRKFCNVSENEISYIADALKRAHGVQVKAGE